MALRWRCVTVGPFAMNAYILWCDETQEGLLIDPGDEIERIADEVEDTGARLQRIIITHAHIDHVLRSRQAQDHFNLPLYMHRDDAGLLQNVSRQAEMMGLSFGEIKPPRIDGYLEEGDLVACGRHSLRIVHGPGHSPGSIMLFSEKIAVVGDVLFQGSIGRTDLPLGSYETLMKTITEKLMTLADEVLVLPGHGEETTIGSERRHNPFLQPGNRLFDLN